MKYQVGRPGRIVVAKFDDGDDVLERFQRLHCSLETDRSRNDAMPVCRLSDNCTDQIVSQDVGPDFLADKFWRLTTQDVHLHRLFQ